MSAVAEPLATEPTREWVGRFFLRHAHLPQAHTISNTMIETNDNAIHQSNVGQ
jgi:hypothetical protein